MTQPNTAVLVNALGWIDDRRWGRRRRQICHEILAEMITQNRPMVEFSRRERDTRVPGVHRSHDLAMKDLAEKNVLVRSGRRGCLPELFGLDERVYRWQVPWVMGKAEVLVRLERFFLRPNDHNNGGAAGPGATPGPRGKSLAQGLPQGQPKNPWPRGYPWASTRGVVAHPDSWSEPLSQRHKSATPTDSLKTDDVVVRSDENHDDEEAFAVLRAAIGQHADGTVWPGSTPWGQLRRVATRINGQMPSALKVIEGMGSRGTRSPAIYVAALAELLDPTGPAGAEILERHRLEQRLSVLAGLRSEDERWEQEAREVEQRLATIGA
jgi:hypothetical protein